MKSYIRSTKWKTDPRAVLIPPALMTFIVAAFCFLSAPAWSFETYHAHMGDPSSQLTASSKDAAFNRVERQRPSKSSPVQVDSCLPLLSSTHPSHLDRTQRSAGKAAALSLVFGVRFALTPPKTSKSSENFKPQLDVWQPQTASVGNRSALAIASYRECQKRQALNELKGFRWKR